MRFISQSRRSPLTHWPNPKNKRSIMAKGNGTFWLIAAIGSAALLALAGKNASAGGTGGAATGQGGSRSIGIRFMTPDALRKAVLFDHKMDGLKETGFATTVAIVLPSQLPGVDLDVRVDDLRHDARVRAVRILARDGVLTEFEKARRQRVEDEKELTFE